MNEADRNVLRVMLSKRKLDPYISHIRFPHYKNLTEGTRIDFNFPITALVGINGTNKSSVLRAIQGAPGNRNLGTYWFATSTDQIDELKNWPHSFIYGYFHSGANKVVEVLKTRVRKAKDPDYWEPSRGLASYDMAKMDDPVPSGNKSKTRWDTISKPVVYVDFRQTISAFDRSFYYGLSATYRQRKQLLRRRSRVLWKAIAFKMASYIFYGQERITENRLLNSDELAAASRILGREYSEIRWIRHRFFDMSGATCVLKVEGLSYTEAFAGSGEFAVVRLVQDLVNAKEHSLVILDEPEVSLHPGAQERLMEFLFKRVKLRKYQIVIATHSPGIIRWLPPDAIKVLVVDPSTGKVRLPSQSAAPDEAFFYIGEPLADRRTVIVEDELAKHIVLKALRPEGEAVANGFEVKFFPGGSKTLWASYLPIFSADDRKDMLVLFDGDQRPTTPLPDPATVSELESETLRTQLSDAAGVQIKFGADGGTTGGNHAQINWAVRRLVKWIREHVDYLPGQSSEAFVWEHMGKDGNSAEFEGITDPKKRFDDLARKELGRAPFEPLASQDILGTQLRRLATVPDTLPELGQLRARLLTAIGK